MHRVLSVPLSPTDEILIIMEVWVVAQTTGSLIYGIHSSSNVCYIVLCTILIHVSHYVS